MYFEAAKIIMDMFHLVLRFFCDLGLLYLLWWVFQRLHLLESAIENKNPES